MIQKALLNYLDHHEEKFFKKKNASHMSLTKGLCINTIRFQNSYIRKT